MPHNVFNAAILSCNSVSQHVACWCGVSSGGRKHITQVRTHPICCRWKAHLANKRRGKSGWLTLRRLTKNGGLSHLCVFFFRLPLLCKVQTKCNGSKEKQVTLALWPSVRHHTGRDIIYPGEVILKCQLLNWLDARIWSNATQGMTNIVWHVKAVLPQLIWSQVATTRSWKASRGSYVQHSVAAERWPTAASP